MTTVAWAESAAGLASGGANVVAGHPFDTVKVLLQSSHTPGRGAVAAARHLAQTAGLKALYRGLPAPLLGGALETAVNYAAYGRCRRALAAAGLPEGAAPALLAGAAAGGLIAVVLSPLELLKCRVQAGEDPSVLAAARRVWEQQGGRGFARGLGPTLGRELPGNAVFFASYEALQRCAARHGWQGSAAAAPLCGGVAGVVYWGFVLPLDTAKTRIQVLSPHQPCGGDGLVATLRRQYAARGLGGWYAGSRPVLARAFVANAVQWTVFEAVLSRFRVS